MTLQREETAMASVDSIHWLDVVVVGTLLGGASLGALSGLKWLLFRLIQYSVAIYATVHL